MPIIDWATQRVTTSASVTLLREFLIEEDLVDCAAHGKIGLELLDAPLRSSQMQRLIGPLDLD